MENGCCFIVRVVLTVMAFNALVAATPTKEQKLATYLQRKPWIGIILISWSSFLAEEF